MPFQPILFLALWIGAWRITVSDALPPINVADVLGTYGTVVWTATVLISPPLAAAAWWLIRYRPCRHAAFAGLILRLGADSGMLSALVVYCAAAGQPASEDVMLARHISAAATGFAAALLVRDIWALAMVEHIAANLRRAETLGSTRWTE